MRTVAALALTAQLVAAVNITAPALNQTFTRGQEITVQWTTVDTDPSDFSIYFWNMLYWPPYYQLLAEHVDTSLKKYNIEVPCDVDPEYGYQVNAINGTNVYVIYAQSEKFFVKQNTGTCTDPYSTTACATATTTVTETATSIGNTATIMKVTAVSTMTETFTMAANTTEAK